MVIIYKSYVLAYIIQLIAIARTSIYPPDGAVDGNHTNSSCYRFDIYSNYNVNSIKIETILKQVNEINQSQKVDG